MSTLKKEYKKIKLTNKFKFIAVNSINDIDTDRYKISITENHIHKTCMIEVKDREYDNQLVFRLHSFEPDSIYKLTRELNYLI